MHDIDHLLEVPRIRIQNANAVSSPLTWGFPAMSAFVGLMQMLERKLRAKGIELLFDSVGVICHRHEPQVSRNGFVRGFHLTRNPVDRHGETAAIVEEGRTHLEVTLVFAVSGAAIDAHMKGMDSELAETVFDHLLTLRVAGGSIQSPSATDMHRRRARLISVAETEEEQRSQCRRLLLGWLPGFALVSRDDLLHEHWRQLRQQQPDADLMEAWLDLSRLNMACHQEKADNNADAAKAPVHWERRAPATGWLVPIPVGYGALGPVHDPGTIEGVRDEQVPFRFVESLYSIGEWKSPHRLSSPADILWYIDNRESKGLYRLRNDHGAAPADAN
jgi:CRISPR-associated protein Csy2